MKGAKRKVFVTALVVCLIAILSLGTLAWFNATDEVTNKFMIATSDDTNPDDIFSIDVWENTPDGEKDQDGCTYEDVLPGDVLKKEVYVENTGYYDQYVRVTVTVSDAQAWMDALGTKGAIPKLEQIVDGWNPNASPSVWVGTSREIDSVKDTIIYRMYYSGILEGDIENHYDGYQKDVVNVFTAVKIPTGMTVEQAAAFENNFEINVKADAVQTENLDVDRSNNEIDAVEAFTFAENN